MFVIKFFPCLTGFVFVCFRLRVGELTTFIMTSATVWHIEVDILNFERLLFSENSAIKVTDGVTTTTLVGSSRSGYSEGVGSSANFYYITGFTQINSTSVVVVDRFNHCLRVFDRGVLRTSQFVGTCTISGFTDGISALFNYPMSVVRDVRCANKLLVSEWSNHAVRQVNLITRLTITLISQSNGLSYPRGLTYDIDSDSILISTDHKVSRYSFTSQTLTTVAGGSSTGFRDGTLSSALFNGPQELIILSSSVTLVADRGNRRLRVVNSATGEVESICTGTEGDTDGAAQNCQLNDPSSLLVNGTIIYIGQYGRIRTLRCE